MGTPGRYRQLIRCLWLAKSHAWQGPVTTERVEALARYCGVSTRTIRRDLQALREAGYGECRYTECDIPGDIVRP